MHIIKPCPSCEKKIRFPITKGKIKVTCSCGHSFFADPDDPNLYKNAAFDLKKNKPGKPGKKQSQKKAASPKEISSSIIRRLYDFKYTIQNFRLLPGSEKRKLMLFLVLALLLTAGLVILLNIICVTPVPDATII